MSDDQRKRLGEVSDRLLETKENFDIPEINEAIKQIKKIIKDHDEEDSLDDLDDELADFSLAMMVAIDVKMDSNPDECIRAKSLLEDIWAYGREEE